MKRCRNRDQRRVLHGPQDLSCLGVDEAVAPVPDGPVLIE
ncbi:hypothetical protein BLSMQ_0198 [Brevibacterium aurantiacum]|uniref:Uncharacterized protein n=1 Tax=Brevibacterium aurantiacum TaxID=273384 RepID=A0A1D7VYW6_BREAU|nr:hypothetical protein BLSMQ_0198 [Brevibacterium aurantiacum]